MNQDNKTIEKDNPVSRIHPTFSGKLTPRLRASICEAVRHGTPARNAMRAYGLAHSTITAWEKWAETGEKGQKYVQFARELEQAWNEWVSFVASQGPKHVVKDSRVWRETAAALMPEYAKRDVVEIDIDLGPKLAEIAARVSQIRDADWLALEEPCNTQSHPNEGGITDGGTERVIPSV
jgi:hypothetical protein